VALWSFGRNPAKTTTWEKLAFVLLAASAISVIRNSLFLRRLFALMIVPVSLAWGDRAAERRSDARRTLIKRPAGGAGRRRTGGHRGRHARAPRVAIEYTGQRLGVLTAVERATRADPSNPRDVRRALRRLAAVARPRAGRPDRQRCPLRAPHGDPDQIAIESLFAVLGPNWKLRRAGYRLLVLDKHDDPAAFTAFRAEPGRRILYDDGERARDPCEARRKLREARTWEQPKRPQCCTR